MADTSGTTATDVRQPQVSLIMGEGRGLHGAVWCMRERMGATAATRTHQANLFSRLIGVNLRTRFFFQDLKPLTFKVLMTALYPTSKPNWFVHHAANLRDGYSGCS